MKTEDKTTLIVPFIHLNGTSAERLTDDLAMARDTLQAAYDAIKQTAPNGRDYYCHPWPNAMETATEQHLDRLRRVDLLIDELDSIINAVYDTQQS
jgi:hypothetical protein